MLSVIYLGRTSWWCFVPVAHRTLPFIIAHYLIFIFRYHLLERNNCRWLEGKRKLQKGMRLNPEVLELCECHCLKLVFNSALAFCKLFWAASAVVCRVSCVLVAGIGRVRTQSAGVCEYLETEVESLSNVIKCCHTKTLLFFCPSSDNFCKYSISICISKWCFLFFLCKALSHIYHLNIWWTAAWVKMSINSISQHQFRYVFKVFLCLLLTLQLYRHRMGSVVLIFLIV